MKINFIIPNIPAKPTGGYKIMYQYANAFAEHGHDVYLYHVATIDKIKYNIPHWLRMVRTWVSYRDSKPKWFTLNEKIKTINIPRIDAKYIRPADANMLTMWAEVLEFAKIGDSIGKRINLVQGYEIWFGNEQTVHNSFLTGATNIAISRYLADIINKVTGQDTPIIANPISEVFEKKRPLEDRNKSAVSMLYSEHLCKGSAYGLKALELVKKEIPELEVQLFGTFNAPQNLPDWINYQQCPDDLCGLYNSVSIHVSPSVNDGWDLPCTEAMKCGCALVCTDIAGHKEYAFEGETALLAKAEDAQDLANRITEAIQNNELREKIARQGELEAAKYTMEAAYNRLYTILSNDKE